MVLAKLTLFAIILSASAFFVYFSLTGDAFFFHIIPEGHVGVYSRWGAVLEHVNHAGIHFMNPLTTDVNFVQTTMQTDVVKEIPCGTSGGVMIFFDKIEVVNRLSAETAARTVKEYGVEYDRVWIFDKIHHEINQFCSKNSLQEVYIDKFDSLDESLVEALQRDCDRYDTGIEIIAIRVTKPRIPNDILEKYKEIEREKANLNVVLQQQKAAEASEQTERAKATIRAQKESEIAQIEAEQQATVSRIHQQQITAEKRAEAERQLIENELHLAKEQAITQARTERLTKEAQATQAKLTPEYLQLEFYKYISTALGNNNLLYFGKELPDLFQSLTAIQQQHLLQQQQLFFRDQKDKQQGEQGN